MALVPSLAVGGSLASRAPLVVPLQVPRAQASSPLSSEHSALVSPALASAALAATAYVLRRQLRTAMMGVKGARKPTTKRMKRNPKNPKYDDGPGSSAPIDPKSKPEPSKYDLEPIDPRRREVMGDTKKREAPRKKVDPDTYRPTRAQMREYGWKKEVRNGREYIGKWKVPDHSGHKNRQTLLWEEIQREKALEKQRESETDEIRSLTGVTTPTELGELVAQFQSQQPNPTVTCKTNIGDFQVEVFLDKMPITASNFLDLSYRGFYNGLHFHRVVKDFIIQFGCPSTQEPNAPFAGMHGPEHNTIFPIVDGTKRWVKRLRGHIPDEFEHEISNLSGTISMANQGKPDTGGSQFFINISNNAYLDWFDRRASPAHPVFGRVIQGWKVVKAISEHDTDRRQQPIEPVRMIEMIVDDWVDDEDEEEEEGASSQDDGGFGQRRLARGNREETHAEFQARKRKEIEEGPQFGVGGKKRMYANVRPANQDLPIRGRVRTG